MTPISTISLEDSVQGAVYGYLSLWLIFHAYKITTGKIGMGYGDFKLVGAICAWTGIESLASVLLLSSISGVAVGGVLILTKKITPDQTMPFGPFLILSGFSLMFF